MFLVGANVIDATLTRPSDTNAYTANDAVSDSTSAPSVITFSNIVKVNNRGDFLVAIYLIDSANQATKPQFRLWLFDTAPTAINDNAAFTITDAEMNTVISVIDFDETAIQGNVTAGAGGNCLFKKVNLGKVLKCTTSSKSIYGLLQVLNAYTPVSGEVFTIRLMVSDSGDSYGV